MATHPIGGAPAPVILSGTLPPMPAVARILARHDRGKLAAFVTVAIDLLDVMDGDPDAEHSSWPEDVRAVNRERLPEDSEPGGDEADAAWIEWNTMRDSQKRGPNILAGHEDDEEADPGEEDDPAGQSDEDGVNTGGVPRFGWGGPIGAGCPISDPGGCQHDGREPDDGY